MSLILATQVLVIEDHPGHRELLAEALALQGFGRTSRIERRLDDALAFLEATAALPDSLPRVILLDLKLGEGDGREWLRRLRRDRRFATIPVVILTMSDHHRDIAAAYAAGANAYVVKPDTFDDLVTMIGDLCRFWLTWNHRDCAVVADTETRNP